MTTSISRGNYAPLTTPKDENGRDADLSKKAADNAKNSCTPLPYKVIAALTSFECTNADNKLAKSIRFIAGLIIGVVLGAIGVVGHLLAAWGNQFLADMSHDVTKKADLNCKVDKHLHAAFLSFTAMTPAFAWEYASKPKELAAQNHFPQNSPQPHKVEWLKNSPQEATLCDEIDETTTNSSHSHEDESWGLMPSDDDSIGEIVCEENDTWIAYESRAVDNDS